MSRQHGLLIASCLLRDRLLVTGFCESMQDTLGMRLCIDLNKI